MLPGRGPHPQAEAPAKPDDPFVLPN